MAVASRVESCNWDSVMAEANAFGLYVDFEDFPSASVCFLEKHTTEVRDGVLFSQ